MPDKLQVMFLLEHNKISRLLHMYKFTDPFRISGQQITFSTYVIIIILKKFESKNC